ncbi:MAG: hypothetical protein JWN70_1942 [Planctomycetaceae bacterium]|nr:hypothetical protein [Planctomycetaceae bacterium]
MPETSSEILQSFLANPREPTWSSFAMDRLFSHLEGDTPNTLNLVLRLIDDRFSSESQPLTDSQANFIRDVTVRNYFKGVLPITANELCWLFNRFDVNPTPQRALMIVLLISRDELTVELANTIKAVLSGTRGELWVYGQ